MRVTSGDAGQCRQTSAQQLDEPGGRKTSSPIYKNILPLVKEHLDEGSCCTRGATGFGFRKEVHEVFLVVIQLNGGEGGRGEAATPAWLKI